MAEGENVKLVFSNYNYAFSHFYMSYTQLCEDMSNSENIKKVFKLLYSFISDFSYAVPDRSDKKKFITFLVEARRKIDEDKNLNELLSYPQLSREQEIELLKIYYTYYFTYLKVLADFISKLGGTLMPSTTKQKRMIRFFNNQMFFEKLVEYKRRVSDEVSTFSILNFKVAFNSFITYYYAYRLFVIETDKLYIDDTLHIIINKLLDKKTTELMLLHPNLTGKELHSLRDIESKVETLLIMCNYKINESFSKFGVYPKIEEKIYIDRCLV